MRHPRWLSISLVLTASALPSPLFAGQPAEKPPRPAFSETPLDARERAAQVLNRFSFGPRPGDLEMVMNLGVDKWFEQQLNPESIPDPVLEQRLQDYPALALSPALTVANFPTNQILKQISEGKIPGPGDPTLAAVYQVLEARYTRQQQARKDEQTNTMSPAEIDARKAEQKKQDRTTAVALAAPILAMPEERRLDAIVRLPLEQRMVLTAGLPEPQKKTLFTGFTPREREVFTSMGGDSDAARVVDVEFQQAKLVRAILSERQLQEVMTDFWFNHFNVFLNKDTDQIYTPSYERDAIRPYALGKFRDLLLATAEHPAMLVYLDNWQSIGPGSQAAARPLFAGKQVERGLNENYGREVMELHTVGVNGGYTQADVTALSKILTGWTIDHPEFGGGPVFDPRKHEPGDKIWFGQKIKQNGFKEGQMALVWLAAQPQTAHFISYKLAQRFVADDPPPALVDRMARSFLASDGDIKTVLRTMERSPEFWSRQYYRAKVKTPLEFVASAFRATETDPANTAAVVNTLKAMGEPLYQMQPPTGYPVTADHWMNSAAIVDRLNFSLSLTAGTLGGKVSGIPFNAPRLLDFALLGDLDEPAPAEVRRVSTGSDTASATAASSAGHSDDLSLMEQTMMDAGTVSSQTNGVILKQIAAQEAGASPPDATQVLNTMAAMILGSPEFQLK